ncbi:MAG: hypothetical protein M3463_04560 [Verrucomicrobiota bacterium]|nr:hypothetical protein [Verrucomicrobiota bacterium]
MTLTADGEKIDVPAGRWHLLHGADADRLWAIHARGLTFLRFWGDIPAVLAQDDPAHFFLPSGELTRAAAAPAIDVTSRFEPGPSGEDGDQAAVFTPGRLLQIPRGKALGPEVFEHLDYRRGALEMWLRPRWSTGMALKSAESYFLSGAFWNCWYRHEASDEDDPNMRSAFHFGAPARKAPAQKS